MEQKVLVHDSLRLTLTEIEAAIYWVGDNDYYLSITKDDNEDYVINPKIEEIDGAYNVYDLDEYGQLEKNHMTFEQVLQHFNISGYRLAQLSGVPQSTISSLVTGNNNIRKAQWETVDKLCKALKVTIDQLDDYLSKD